MKQVTETELTMILLGLKGAQPVTFTAVVDARCRKTGNPYEEVRKFSCVNGFTGHDYEKSVNRQLIREEKTPDFEAQERRWGENINGIVVEKDGKFYMRVKPQRSKKPIYIARRPGQPFIRVEKSKIEEWLPKVYPAQNQGTDKEILHRDYMISNLRTVSIAGERFVIIR